VKMERTRASHMICVGERINVSEWCMLWCFKPFVAMGIGVNPTFWRSSDETSPIF
jgi:hypothetical protein